MTPARCSASPTCIRACSAGRCGWRWIRRRRTTRRRSARSTSAISRCAGNPALDRVVSGAPGEGQGRRGIFRTASRVHALARPHGGARRRGARTGGGRDHRRADRLRQERRASARHLRAVLRPQQHVRAIPIVGLFLGGGSNEGLLGITYEASGPPSAPRITVNPVTAIAPGLLRKFIPNPDNFDHNFITPSR